MLLRACGLALLAASLSACEPISWYGLDITALLRPYSAPPTAVCPPPLPVLPDSAMDALVADAKAHPETAGWLTSLEKTYENQDTCAGRHG